MPEQRSWRSARCEFDEVHVGTSWVFCAMTVAVVGELADERIDLAEREGRGGVALEVAADEAVGGGAELEGGGAGVVDDGGAVLLGQGEDAEDAADAGLAVAAVDRVAQRRRSARRRGWRGPAAPAVVGGVRAG